MNYAVLDDQIVFLTGESTKLRAALERAVVAFQIDHIDESTGSGLSVMAVGLAEEITDPEEIRAAEQLDLHPFAAGDRSHFVRLRPEFLSGRRIVTHGAQSGWLARAAGALTTRLRPRRFAS